MLAEDLTIFDLVGTSTHLVAASGGGNPAYGKMNGIAVLSKGALSSGDIHVFYKTEDIIRRVAIYEEGASYTDFKHDEYSEENADNIKEESNDQQNQAVRTPLLFIVAAGLSFLYLLKYDGEITLLSKVKVRAEVLYFSRHLLILHDGIVSGFYDVIEKPERLAVKEKREEEIDPHEEYFYRLFRKDGEIIYKRESGAEGIPRNWSNFFVVDKCVYKVIREDEKSNFVFNNKKYSYPGEIPRIFVADGMLCFYVTQTSGSMLVFIKEKEMIYNLPRITSMTVDGLFTAVSTSQGDIILYKNGIFRSRTYASPISITGIVLDSTTAYYSTIVGAIEKCSVAPSHRILWLLGALLLIVIAVGIKYWKK